MKIKFNDTGEIITVDSYKSLVDYMRKSAVFIRAKNNHDYMLGYAQRSVIAKNEDIRATDEVSFIEDLISHHHIEVL